MARSILAMGAIAATLLVVGWAALATEHASGAIDGASFGRWYAEGGAAQVEISRCAEGLCGRVVWLRSPFDEDGCELRDRNNPSAELRERSIVGLDILRAASPTACEIYDPVSGRTYNCQFWLDGDDRLRIRGYVGVPLFGRTTTWLRVGSEARTCQDRSTASADDPRLSSTDR